MKQDVDVTKLPGGGDLSSTPALRARCTPISGAGTLRFAEPEVEREMAVESKKTASNLGVRTFGALGAAMLLLLGTWGTPGFAQDPEGAADEAPVEEDADVMSEAELSRELLTVEEEVKRLKERVFRSKATLQLLKELVIEGATLGSRIAIWHVNRMGPAYTMESIDYYLDGKSIFRRVDPSGSLDELREVKVHEQTVPPGAHQVEVNLVLRGSGFGVFSYLRTYSFKVQSSYSVDVDDGNLVNLRVIADERSGLSRTFMDRPYVEYDVANDDLRDE